jgi:hypothetical protein
MVMKRVILSCLISGVLATAASAQWVAETNSVQLSSLPGGSLIVGDKEFSDFHLDIITVSGGAFLPDPNMMTVEGVRWVETGDYGLRFDGVSWDVGSNQSISVNLSFKVSVRDEPEYSNYRIKDVWLALTGGWAFGTGVTGVGENVWANFPGDMNPVASLSCWATSSGNRLTDYKDFEPLKEVYIQAKTLYVSGGPNGFAHFNEFFQFYSQTQTPVPEPATITLVGLAGAIMLRRRHRM